MTTKTKPRRRPLPKSEQAEPEQLPSGRWRVYYWHPLKKVKVPVRNPEAGSRGTWPSSEAAELAREEYKARLDGALIAQGIPVQRQTHRPDIPTVPQAIEQWLDLQDGTKQTVETRKYAVRAFEKQWPDTLVNELDRDTYVRWDLQQKEAGRSTSTRSTRQTYMGQLIRWCVKKQWCKVDWTVDLKPIKVRRIIRPEILTRDHYITVGYYLPFWMLPALVLAYECGLRAGEIAGLTWKRIDLKAAVPTITIRDVMQFDRTARAHTKGGGEDGERVIVLSAYAVEILKAVRRWRGVDGLDDFVVRNGRNRPVPPNYLGKRWVAAWRQAEAAGDVSGPRPRFHDLRHAAGTGLAAAGAPITVIMDVLGHDDPKTTKRYLRDARLAEMAAWMSLVGQRNETTPISYLPTPASPEATTVDQLATSVGLDADALISIVAELGRRGLLRDIDPLDLAA